MSKSIEEILMKMESEKNERVLKEKMLYDSINDERERKRIEWVKRNNQMYERFAFSNSSTSSSSSGVKFVLDSILPIGEIHTKFFNPSFFVTIGNSAIDLANSGAGPDSYDRFQSLLSTFNDYIILANDNIISQSSFKDTLTSLTPLDTFNYNNNINYLNVDINYLQMGIALLNNAIDIYNNSGGGGS